MEIWVVVKDIGILTTPTKPSCNSLDKPSQINTAQTSVPSMMTLEPSRSKVLLTPLDRDMKDQEVMVDREEESDNSSSVQNKRSNSRSTSLNNSSPDSIVNSLAWSSMTTLIMLLLKEDSNKKPAKLVTITCSKDGSPTSPSQSMRNADKDSLSTHTPVTGLLSMVPSSLISRKLTVRPEPTKPRLTSCKRCSTTSKWVSQLQD